jgi:hypothetical protein
MPILGLACALDGVAEHSRGREEREEHGLRAVWLGSEWSLEVLLIQEGRLAGTHTSRRAVEARVDNGVRDLESTTRGARQDSHPSFSADRRGEGGGRSVKTPIASWI